MRLAQHQTLDEVHQALLERLTPFALTISRREVLSLFEAYCTLLQAASAAREDQEWLRQVEANGGLIISIDGIQPDKGNETISLVRDVLTGRVLNAENVSSSEKEVRRNRSPTPRPGNALTPGFRSCRLLHRLAPLLPMSRAVSNISCRYLRT